MLFVFQLYISSVFRIRDGYICFVMKFIADVVPVDGDEMSKNLLPSCPHLVCCSFLTIVEDVVSKCTA